MRKKAQPKIVTPELESIVKSWLVTKAFAETMRAAVNATRREILTAAPLHNRRDGEIITDPERAWMGDDEDEYNAYWDEADRRDRAAGIKPDAMTRDYCPALVAESAVRDIEHLMIDEALTMLHAHGGPRDLTVEAITRSLDGYRKFIDLTVKLVFSSPTFKAPQL